MKADIILRGIEGSLVGTIKSLHGKKEVEEVIKKLLGEK